MQTSISFLFLLLAGGGFGIPQGMPPAAENAAMHRIAPDECLAYYSWSPAGELDASNGNHTEALIADPEVQASMDAIAEILEKNFRQLRRSGTREGEAFANIGPGLIKAALTRAGAIYVRDIKNSPELRDPDIRAGMLLHVGKDGAAIRKGFEAIQSDTPKGAVTEVKIGDHLFYRIQQGKKSLPLSWGVANGYLLVALGDGELQAMAASLNNEPPAWLAKISEQLPLDRRASITYLDVPNVIETIAEFDEFAISKETIAASGFGNVQSFIAVSGFDETGFVTRSELNIDGEPTGAFALLGGRPLTAEDLATIPHDAPAAFALRIEPKTVFDQFLAIEKEFDVDALKEVEGDLGEFKSKYDMSLRDELLNSLGDSARVYASPEAGGLITGWTAVIDLDDAETLRKFHDQMVATAQAESELDDYSPKIDFEEFASHKIYSLHVPDDEMFFTPSWCITEKHFIVGMFPQTVREFLSRGTDFRSLANVPTVKAELEAAGELQMLTYIDTQETVKVVYPLIQVALRIGSAYLLREGIDLDISLLPSATALNRHLQPTIGTVRRNEAGLEFVGKQTIPSVTIGSVAPLAFSASLPAIVDARRSAQLATSMNNLKQIGIGLYNFHDVWNGLPAGYSVDEDGKPLLSWRVHLLPYIGQEELYKMFHLDEPWDSEYNAKLIELMPDVYKSPGARNPVGKTSYLGNADEKSGIFVKPTKDGEETPRGVRFRDIIDGTANTIMVVEVNSKAAVTWTQPGDFELAKTKRTALTGLRKGGFFASYCDASVHFMTEAIPDSELEKLLKRNDGEILDYSYEDFGRRRTIFENLFGRPRIQIDEHMHEHDDAHEHSHEEVPEIEFDISPEEAEMERPLDEDKLEIEFDEVE